MRGQQLADDAPTKKPPEAQISMKEIWDAAAKEFESICGESLQKGQIRSFEDVQKKIKSANQASNGADEEQNVKWEKAKSVGLQSLKYLKMLVGAASQASSFIPIPEAAANITGSALCFVFDIPETIKGYNDAINQVFGEVSSALSQFHIYQTIDNADPLLIQQIHLVLVSFVKVCAYVVKYRQGRKRDRFIKQFKSIFDDDSGLADQMAEFRRALQQQRDVEGTVTLAVVVETQQDVALLLEQSVVFGKTTQETHQAVQAIKDDVDRMRTLIKIRDTLGVPSTVRLDTNTTQTCNDIADKCLSGMGSWIWTHEAYTAWTATKDREKDAQRLLLLSGPPSSGKTCVSALITKRLEEQQKGRSYTAHYFFPSSTKKADHEKNSIQSALKYMAFQIARVDVTVQKVLGKACDEEPAAFRRSGSLESLDSLWEKLKIGASGSSAVYYLVFDGIENLPDQQVKMLLDFVFSPRMAKESAERVQILLSGTHDQFENWPESRRALKMQIEKHNTPDMRIVIEEALNQRGMLLNAKPGSDQQRARDKILDKLPQNVEGSYSRLQFGLEDVMRLLSTRTAMRELDRMLDQSMSSHEAAIKNLQRSLTADEIGELNELLKWVLFSNDEMTLERLEAAMFLYSETESLASLEYIIKSKYSAVLKLEDGCVFGQDGVKEYLRKDIDSTGRTSNTKDRATISMTITINNVDQELCGHFLWDLAHKAIRDKFDFNLDGDASNALHGGSRGTIAVDEFEAHHTIVTRAFEYLSKPPREQTKKIGSYLICWLPFHLDRLRQLEDDDQGSLMPSEQFEIGQNLYKLFKNGDAFLRHKEIFQEVWWIGPEMDNMQKWLMDSAVMRKLDRRWRDEVQSAASPTRGYLKELARIIIEGFLRDRSWQVSSASMWLPNMMRVDEKRLEGYAGPSDAEFEAISEINWSLLSTWCQGILALPDSELNSLWYERLATAAALENVNLDLTISLYQSAIEKKNPSWLCYQGLGTAFYNQGRASDAKAQVELALERAQQEDATPKPEAKDIVGLYLLLGQFAYDEGDVRTADKYYSLACEGGVASQVRDGQLGRLKARLGFPSVEETRQLLRSILAEENGKEEMTAAMEMLALDPQHNDLIARLFAVAKQDSDLLKEVLDAMEKATLNLAPGKGGKDYNLKTLTGDERFAEDEARSVLLCDRGFASYLFRLSPNGVNEALPLWEESRELLNNVGGSNALLTRQRATTALANHYFQSIVDGLQLDYYDSLTKLTKLAKSDPDYNTRHSDSNGFLGATLMLCGKKESAKEVLRSRMKQGLQILSDDILDNDNIGYSILQKTLEHYQDFKNAFVALSLLGQPDFVTEVLSFEASDITEADGAETLRILDVVTEMAKEVIRVTHSRVPDARLQVQRIEAAKTYVDTLVPDVKTDVEVNGNGKDENSRDSDLTAHAYRLLRSRILPLHQKHIPNIDAASLTWSWGCDGRTLDGKGCDKWNNFELGFYHCIYCSNNDFCGDCLARLRDPESGVQFMQCSAKHKWVHMPHQGNSVYVGTKAKSVRVPIDVKPLDDDDRILKAYYAEDGSGEEITVEAWKERLAVEWGLSIREIMNESASEDEKS
ncbi:hypothetical protein V8C35DRAFT_295371 [Trichoderma chlorosporum]